MHLPPYSTLVSAGCAGWVCCVASLAVAADREPRTVAQGFVEKHCMACHAGDSAEAGLRLDGAVTDLADRKAFGLWVRVHDKVAKHEMPPADADQPPQAEREAVLRALAEPLAAADLAYQLKFGRTVLRRLNRVEYEHTLRDLLALPHIDLRELLPADPSAHGFDVVGEALPMSYVQQAAYLQAADAALNEAVTLRPQPPRKLYAMKFLDTGRLAYPKDVPRPADGLALMSNFTLGPPFYIGFFGANAAGPYRLHLRARTVTYHDGELSNGEKPQVIMLYAEVGTTSRHVATFEAPIDRLADLEVTTWLNAGEKIRLIAPTMMHSAAPYRANQRDLKYLGPSIAFETFEADGPIFDSWPPESHHRVLRDVALVAPPAKKPPPPIPLPLLIPNSPDPAADAARLVEDFVGRAFRGPAPPEEVQRYVGLARQRLEAGARLDEAVRTGCKASLCSPDFLYFQEQPGRLAGYALANRLSYFLWRSLPDDTLLVMAQSGRLHEPKELHAQVERLLNDQRSARFVEDFTDQWLGLRSIGFTQPDEDLYPEYKDLHLQDSLVRETRAYFAELLADNLPARCVAQADFVCINGQLAELYEIDGVAGVEIRKVPIPAGHVRGGFVTQASVLKVTANGTTTSPVVRGAWLIDRIVGRPAPPPPANVPAIEPDIRGATTVREMLARHRADSKCAGCHAKIDPPGFALESFDIMGGFRQRYRSLGEGTSIDKKVRGWKVKYKLGPLVDTSGETDSGQKFADIRRYKQLLVQDEPQLARNLVEKLITYSTGARSASRTGRTWKRSSGGWSRKNTASARSCMKWLPAGCFSTNDDGCQIRKT